MERKIVEVIECYQCPGCVCGMDISCYKKGEGLACVKHVAGTRLFPYVGLIFLGLPVGFCRLGQVEETEISIFACFADGWGYNKFNVPVWKHLDEHGNTLVRGISPRVNQPWIHIFIGDCLNKIDCLEITSEDISEMD